MRPALQRSHIPHAVSAPVEVPAELQAYDQWVGWSYRPTKAGLAKVPYRLPPLRSGGRAMAQAASSTDPFTWASYDVARHYPKVGFVFTRDDPFCGIDLDGCLDPETGELSFVARVALRYLASYAEISPSGRGVKIIARGSVPGERRQNRALGVEMYDDARFFALTGERLPGASEHTTEADLAPLYRWLFGLPQNQTSPPVNTGGAQTTASACPTSRRTNDQIIRKALCARNGRRFEKLWSGDASGYPTHSEADLALCAMLVYWAGPDFERIEALFSASGLCRKKWSERPDYRRRTIERAIATARR